MGAGRERAGWWRKVRNFVVVLFGRDVGPAPKHDGHSIASVIRESSHVQGGRGGAARGTTERQHKLVAKGHKNFKKSFKKNR